MADILIECYSRTGTAQSIAKRMQAHWDAELEMIKPLNSFSGGVGALRGMSQVFRGKQPLIVVGKKAAGYRRVVLVTPIWADHIATPAATWLTRQRNEGLRALDIITVSASENADLAFQAAEKGMDGMKLAHLLHVHKKALASEGIDKVLSSLLGDE